jgi:hypothetical protein
MDGVFGIESLQFIAATQGTAQGKAKLSALWGMRFSRTTTIVLALRPSLT